MDDHSDYEVLGLSTTDVDPGDRADYWQGHVQQNHGYMGFDFADRRPFVGSTLVQRAGRFQLVEFTSNDILYRRTSRHIRRDDDRSARLVIPLTGDIDLTQLDETERLTPGQVGLVSMGRPMALEHDDGARAWILTVPEETIPRTLANRSVIALDRRRPLVETVVAMTNQLVVSRDDLTAYDFVQISSTLIDLALKAVDDKQVPHVTVLAALADAARQYVLDHSNDPTLTADTLAAAMGCSTRQLYKALKVLGTAPAEMLRHTRLERANALLHDPACVATIATIAHTVGFGSVSAFKDAYQRRYDIQPGAARRLHTPKPAAAG